MLSFTNPTNPDIRMAVALLLAIASSSTLERKQLREDTLFSFDGWALLQVEIGWSHQFDEVIKPLQTKPNIGNANENWMLFGLLLKFGNVYENLVTLMKSNVTRGRSKGEELAHQNFANTKIC